MKVVRKNEKKKVNFADLNKGDCFEWVNSVLIKTDYEQDAVDLVDGTVYSGICGEDVYPVNAEVHIID